MRTFWIITLVLVTVLVMATAASASVRDSVASLVGARSGAAADSGGGGTFTVTATKTGGEPDGAGEAWVVKTESAGEDACENAGETQAISFGPVEDPAGDGECDADRTGDEIAPVGPKAEVQPEEPVANETVPKAKKGAKSTDEPVAE